MYFLFIIMLFVSVYIIIFFTPETVEFPDYTYEIGQAAKMRCQINRIRMWDAISMNGTQDVKGQDKPLSFKLLSNNETCLEGNDSRITTEVDIKQTRNPSAKYDDIKMVVHFSEIQCQDMGAYECWVDGPTAYRVMNSLTVKRECLAYCMLGNS